MSEQSAGDFVLAGIIGHDRGIRVLYEPADTVLRITIDSGRGNRIGLQQMDRLLDIAKCLGRLEAAEACRVVVLDAAGPDFSHGANLSDPGLIARLGEGREAQVAFARCGQALVSCWRTMPVPTIAVATGHVLGAGACLFMASDFRIASPGTLVRFPEVDRGMHLGWGIVPRLVSLLGETRALQLALLGDALEVATLADAVTVANDPPAESVRQAVRLATKPPLAIRAILDTLRKSSGMVDAAAADDAERWADTLASADFAEAMAAWYERRPAIWKGR